jgi:hypothetical protein
MSNSDSLVVLNLKVSGIGSSILMVEWDGYRFLDLVDMLQQILSTMNAGLCRKIMSSW